MKWFSLLKYITNNVVGCIHTYETIAQMRILMVEIATSKINNYIYILQVTSIKYLLLYIKYNVYILELS